MAKCTSWINARRATATKFRATVKFGVMAIAGVHDTAKVFRSKCGLLRTEEPISQPIAYFPKPSEQRGGIDVPICTVTFLSHSEHTVRNSRCCLQLRPHLVLTRFYDVHIRFSNVLLDAPQTKYGRAPRSL